MLSMVESQYVRLYQCGIIMLLTVLAINLLHANDASVYPFKDMLHMCLLVCIVWLQRGVFGPSVLSLHRHFSLPSGVVVDDLHSIYLGVVLQMLRLWFDRGNRGKPFYIGDKVHMLTCEMIFFFFFFERL